MREEHEVRSTATPRPPLVLIGLVLLLHAACLGLKLPMYVELIETARVGVINTDLNAREHNMFL